MEEKSRNSGIDVVGKIKWGTHFCQFFQTEQDFTDIVIPYIATGLENNEFCVWILPDIPASEEKKKALKKIPHIDTYLEKEQIEIIPFSGFHLKENLLKSKGTLNFWNKKLEMALNRGYSGLRVVENNSFQEKNSNYEKESWNDLLDYEENLNFFVNEDKEHKILFLCTYELGLCSPVEIIELSKIHHFVLAKKQEKWKLLETSIQRNRAERFQAEEKLEGKKLEKGKIEPEKGCQNIKELHNAEKEMHNGYKEIQAQSEKLQTFKGFNEEFQLKSEERQAQAEELKDAYEELGKSEKRYRMLFTNMSEGFLLGEPLYDEKGRSYDYRFLEVNPAFELNTGLKREEILGRTIRAVLKNPSSLAIEKYGEVAHSGEPAYVEIFSQELNRYLDNYIFCPEKGKFATIFRDVTERKKMEIVLKKQEEHLEDLLKSIQDGFFELDKDWKFTYINRRASENVGFKPEELIGECIWKKFPWTPGSKYETGFKQVMEARKPFSFEVESTAGERWYEINAYPSGSGISVFWMEITERKKAEKALFGAYERIQAQSGELQAYNEELQVQTEELEAQAEELQETNKALHESEEKLRLLGDNLPDSAIYQYMHESDGRVRFLYCSAGIEQLNGVSSENVLRDPSVLHSQIPQPYYDRLVEAEAQSAKELSYFDMEIPMYRPDGQVRWMRLHSHPRILPDCRIVWDGVQTDITSRKQAEEALQKAYAEIQSKSLELQASNEELEVQAEELQAQAEELKTAYEALSESEKRYRLLFAHSIDAIIVTDPEAGGKILSANPAACKLLGWKEEELIGKGRDALFDLSDSSLSSLLKERKQAGSARTELTYRRKDGTHFIGELSTALFKDISGGEQAVVILRDVTERRQMEEALKESEKRYRTLFTNMTEGFGLVECIYDENGKPYNYRYLEVNPAFERYLGVKREAILGKTMLELFPNVNSTAFKNYEEVLLSGKPANFEIFSEIAKKYLEIYVFSPAKGKIALILRDVSERKKTEEALRKSEEKYRMLFSNMSEAFLLGEIICDKDGNPCNYICLDANPAYERHAGVKREDIIGKSILELYPDASRIAIEKYGRTALSGKPVYFEFFSQALSRHLEVNVFSPEFGKFAVIFRDVTERKRLEEQIRQRAEEVETVMKVAPAAIWIGHDPQCHNITGNQMANEFYEAEEGENVSANVTPVRRFFYKGKELTADELPMQESALKDTDIKNVEFDVLLPSGKWRALLGSASPLHDAKGIVRGSVGTFIDITERKQNEEKLQQVLKKAEEGERLLAALMENVPEGITIADASGRLLMVSKRGEDLLGGTHADKSIDEVVTQWEIYQPDEITPMATEDTPLSRAVQKGEAVRDAELVQINTQGKKISLLCNAAPIRNSEGDVTGGIVAWHDITERKKAEKALNLAYEQIQIQSEELEVQYEELQDQSEKLKEINEALRESEERYRTLFSTMDQGFCVIEMLFDENQKPIDYLFVETNPAFERHTGFKNAVGKRIRELAPENEEYWYKIYGRVALTGEPVRFENRAKVLNRWYEVYAYRIGQRESRKVAILFNDITERKQIEETLKKAHEDLEEKVKERTKQLAKAYKSLKESERGLAEAQKMAHIGNWDWNLLTRKIHWSDEKYRIFGLKPRELELTYDLFLRYIHPEDKDYLDKLNKRACKGEPYTADFRIISADGIERILHEQCEVIFDEKNIPVRIQGTTQDITERKKTEKALAELETARLKEIHHRIKNNLQVISSLLDLQAENLNNKADLTHSEILEAFRESQDRVASIALIHEELYAGKGTDSLNFSLYLQKLVKSLFQTYRVGSANIGLKLDLPENIFFDMDNAIPLGIIVNELVSNSLKHAFPGRDRGEIKIKILREKDFSERSAKAGVEGNNEENNIRENKAAGEKKIEKVERAEKAQKPGINNTGINETLRINYTLMVSDNGVGIPENLDLENSETLGLQLVSILTEQLDGKLELKRSPGSQFILNFSLSEG